MERKPTNLIFRRLWSRFWMRFAGTSPLGRISASLASWGVSPYYRRSYLSGIYPKGYISPKATIHHKNLSLDPHIFIDDSVLIYQDNSWGPDGGSIEIKNNVMILRYTIIQTGAGGRVVVGSNSSIQPRCQISAYKSSIQIGANVLISPNCAFYPYDHGIAMGELIRKQPLKTKGGIMIQDDVWLGVGVIVLDGVKIGKGAVIGAGSVVTNDIPDGAVAMGVPTRVVKIRGE